MNWKGIPDSAMVGYNKTAEEFARYRAYQKTFVNFIYYGPTLGDDNYPDWCIWMLDIIENFGDVRLALDPNNQTIERLRALWPECSIIFALLRRTVDARRRAMLATPGPTPLEAWERLKARWQADSYIKQSLVLEQMVGYVWEVIRGIKALGNDMEDLLIEMRGAGKVMDEADVVPHLLRAVERATDQFDNQIDEIRRNPALNTSLPATVGVLQQREHVLNARMAMRARTTTVDNASMDMAAPVIPAPVTVTPAEPTLSAAAKSEIAAELCAMIANMRMGGHVRKGKGKGAGVICCYRCHGEGHKEAQCPSPKPSK